MTEMNYADEQGLSAKIKRHKEFLSPRLDCAVKGLVIGTLSAPPTLILHWLKNDPEELNRGANAVFSVETQVFMFAMLLGTLALVPLVPLILRLSVFIYDTILFGLAFLFATAGWFGIASYVLEDPEKAKNVLLGLCIALVPVTLAILAIGPLIFEDLGEYTVHRNRWRAFKGKKRLWCLFYVVWVAAFAGIAYYASSIIQSAPK